MEKIFLITLIFVSCSRSFSPALDFNRSKGFENVKNKAKKAKRILSGLTKRSYAVRSEMPLQQRETYSNADIERAKSEIRVKKDLLSKEDQKKFMSGANLVTRFMAHTSLNNRPTNMRAKYIQKFLLTCLSEDKVNAFPNLAAEVFNREDWTKYFFYTIFFTKNVKRFMGRKAVKRVINNSTESRLKVSEIFVSVSGLTNLIYSNLESKIEEEKDREGGVIYLLNKLIEPRFFNVFFTNNNLTEDNIQSLLLQIKKDEGLKDLTSEIEDRKVKEILETVGKCVRSIKSFVDNYVDC